jgi:hypothetical protein
VLSQIVKELVPEFLNRERPMQKPVDFRAGENAFAAVIHYAGYVAAAWLFFGLLSAGAHAKEIEPVCPGEVGHSKAPTVLRADLPTSGVGANCNRSEDGSMIGGGSSSRLIVIGFMGGRVKGNNLIHREALVAKELQEVDPRRVYAGSFANHDAQSAFNVVIALLDTDRDGRLSADEKGAARIVIYGHSWGASETVAFARRLNTLNIPVLLTIQVDSVQKPNEDDGDIPPNVHEAINFYQTEGMLHGRSSIAAMDPKQTKILGNYESSYRSAPVSCEKFPWFARTFMKAHIEIENDPSVWGKIAALIRTKF